MAYPLIVYAFSSASRRIAADLRAHQQAREAQRGQSTNVYPVIIYDVALGNGAGEGVVRRCSYPGCSRPNMRTRANYCRQHGAEASRRWRARRAADRQGIERERDRKRSQDPRRIAKVRAHAKLSTYLRRGKVKKGRCFGCLSTEVQAHIPDLHQPLAVEWWCTECRRDNAAEREAKRIAAAQERARATRQAAWIEHRDAVLSAVAALPAEERVGLENAAARGPLGIRLSPESPMYVQQLVRAYDQRYLRTADASSADTT